MSRQRYWDFMVASHSSEHLFWLMNIQDACIIGLDLLGKWGTMVDVHGSTFCLRTKIIGFKEFSGKGPSLNNCVSDATKTPSKATRKTRAMGDSSVPLNPSKRFSALPPRSHTSPVARDCSSPHFTETGPAAIVRHSMLWKSCWREVVWS